MSTYAFIKSKLNGNVIAIEGAAMQPAELLDAFPRKSTGNDNQQWEFVPDPAGSGFHFIKSKLEGNVIQIHNTATAAGAKLEACPQETPVTDGELWEFVPDVVDPSFFFIESKLNGHVIDIEGALTRPGTGLEALPRKTKNNNSQLWRADGEGFPPRIDVPSAIGFFNLGTGSGTASGGSTDALFACHSDVGFIEFLDGIAGAVGSAVSTM